MKIVYLIAGTYNAGGMERVLANKANWLAAHGYDVTVVTTDQRGRKPCFPMDARIRTTDLDINYDADNGRLLSKLVRYPLRQWRHRRRLTRLLRELCADIVVCMFNNDVSFVHRISDGSHKILEVHFSKNKKLQYGRHGLWALADNWRTHWEERLVSRYERFVVLTHEDMELWGRLPNMTVIPNARTFDPLQRASLQQKQVLAIGRYDYQKGFDTLLYIWHLLGSRTDGWTLNIVGDGPMRQQLERQKTNLQLNNVTLSMPTTTIQQTYVNASIVVMTSRYEGLPMVLLEAQSFGLPIVAFACQCGPRDIIANGQNGFLVDEGDTRQFAECLYTLMNDETLRHQMGTQALANSTRYTTDAVMSQWDQLFQTVIDT